VYYIVDGQFKQDNREEDKRMNILKLKIAEKDLSVGGASKLCGIDPTTISLLCNGRQKAQLRTLVRLSKGLEIPLDELMFLYDDSAKERGAKGTPARKAKKRVEQEQGYNVGD
jgi:transcriptional regulator with XRE-family HTH domain